MVQMTISLFDIDPDGTPAGRHRRTTRTFPSSRSRVRAGLLALTSLRGQCHVAAGPDRGDQPRSERRTRR